MEYLEENLDEWLGEELEVNLHNLQILQCLLWLPCDDVQ